MHFSLVETIIGIYALDEKNEIKAKQTWPSDPKTIAKIMLRLREGDASIISDLLSELDFFNDLVLNSSNQALVDSLKGKINTEFTENIDVTRKLKNNISKLAVEAGLIDDEYLYGEFSHEVLNEIARMDVHDKLSNREALLTPSVQLLGEVDTVLNAFSNRMREWYGVHFPEMSARVGDHVNYARIITNIGFKENITAKGLMELSLKKKDAERIEKAATTSLGAKFEDVDRKAIIDFAQRTLDLYKYREELFEYISMVAKEVAPNLAFIAGPVLAAKLIEKAGSLKKLGMMPSSTIQVLGAEKAMFRAIKSNARPPKHGLLYQHPYVNKSPRVRRGNRARSLAAKIAIATRADFFSGDFIAEDLVSQLEDF